RPPGAARRLRARRAPALAHAVAGARPPRAGRAARRRAGRHPAGRLRQLVRRARHRGLRAAGARRVAAGGRVMLETRRIDGAPPTLVFLHEGLGCVGMWRDFPDRVAAAAGLGALVYSRRGYGASGPIDLPRPVSFMHDEAWEVLPELLAAQRIERPLLVGHSDGASIALLHAARHPVRAVVALAPHVFVEDISVSSIARAAEAYRT